MKLRMAALVAAIVLVCPLASAQTPVIGAGFSSGTALPAACSATNGDLFFKTTDADPANIGLYECYAANTWRKLGTGGGGGAPTDAQYLVLALNGTLSAERRLVFNAPFETSDGGANGDFTITCRTASGAQSGCLDPGDFSTFNSKIGGSGTADTIAKFSAAGAITDSAIVEDSDSVNFSKKIEVTEIVITGAGAGAWQFTTGTLGVGDASTVKIGAHTGNVFSVSENGGAVTPVIIGTRVNFPNNAPTDDNVFVGSGSAWEVKALPDCTDTGGNHLNYTASTNAFSCGTSGGASGLGYGLQWGGRGPGAAANTYYFGFNWVNDYNNTSARNQLQVPKASTLKKGMVSLYVDGTLATVAGEVIDVNLRINDTTDVNLCTVRADARLNFCASGALSQALSVGDKIEVKAVMPGSWTTTPTNLRWQIVGYAE